MTIVKHKDSKITYYEAKISKGVHVYAFNLRSLIIDLVKIHGFSLFNPLNLN